MTLHERREAVRRVVEALEQRAPYPPGIDHRSAPDTETELAYFEEVAEIALDALGARS